MTKTAVIVNIPKEIPADFFRAHAEQLAGSMVQPDAVYMYDNKGGTTYKNAHLKHIDQQLLSMLLAATEDVDDEAQHFLISQVYKPIISALVAGPLIFDQTLSQVLEKHSHAEIGQVLNPRLSVLKNFYEYLYHMIYIGNIYATGAFSGQELDLKIGQALGELAKSMQETCKNITLGDSIEDTIKLTVDGMIRDIKSVNGGADV